MYVPGQTSISEQNENKGTNTENKNCQNKLRVGSPQALGLIVHPLLHCQKYETKL